jgi:hypothetical protein
MNGWQAGLRRELDCLGSWKERSQKINLALEEKGEVLAAREQKLLGLRPAFDELTLDFLRAFPAAWGVSIRRKRSLLAKRKCVRPVTSPPLG